MRLSVGVLKMASAVLRVRDGVGLLVRERVDEWVSGQGRSEGRWS